MLLGEVVARLAYPLKRSLSWYHYDPRYGFRHRESYDALTNDWGEGKLWRFHTNSHGFRWPEWSFAAPRDAKRALVMGDSFTFGDALSDEEAFPGVAAARAGHSWQVINAGTSAWGPAHALAYLESEGKAIEASCLVYAVFEGNDVIDVTTHGSYVLSEKKLVSKVDERTTVTTGTSRIRDALRGPLYDFLLEHSQLFNIIRGAGLSTVAKHDSPARAHDPYHDTSKADFAGGLELTNAVLDRMAAVAHARFGGFVLILIPMRGQLTHGESQSEMPFPRWMAEATHASVADNAAKRGIPVLDLRAVLPREPTELAQLYFQRDFHFNAAGSRLVGEALAKQLPDLCDPK